MVPEGYRRRYGITPMGRPVRAVVGRGGKGEVVGGGVGARAVARGGVGGGPGQFLFGGDGSDFGFVGPAYPSLLGVFAHQATVSTSFTGWMFAAALLEGEEIGER